MAFTYPVVLLDKASGMIKFVSKPEGLSTRNGVKELNGKYAGAKILESGSALYKVRKVSPLGSGNLIQMQTEIDRLLTLKEAKATLSEVVKNPKSRWSRTGKADATVKAIKGAKDLKQLMQRASQL